MSFEEIALIVFVGIITVSIPIVMYISNKEDKDK
jgi:hypothetical protein